MNITNDIIYIGQDDKDIRLFESQYETPDGMCYNSYVIMDDDIAIMDTSDSRTLAAWKEDLKKALNGKQPKYLVVHHMEPDHASGIGDVVEMFPDITVVCSAKAQAMMPLYFPNTKVADKTMVVKEGDSISLGKHQLQFFMAPMVHWPEVMVTYDATDKVLFSADGFGKFGALSADEDWACEARRYYFNICGKYGMQVQKLLKAASALDIQIICPLHGPILKENLGYYIGLYDTWSKYGVETEGVLIAYASIHGGTKVVAEKVAEMFREKNIGKVAITDLCRDDMAEAIEDAFRMNRLVLAAASYDASVFPPMYDFIHHLEMKAYQKRKVGIIENGSWAPTAAKTMKKLLEGCKDIEIVEPTVTIWSRMKESDIPQLQALVDAMV